MVGAKATHTLEIGFERENLKEQFARAHPRVQGMLWAVAEFCLTHGFPAPVVTHVERTWEEHVKIYGSEEKAKKVHSPHLDRPSRAIDIRSIIYTPAQIQSIISFLDKNFTVAAYRHPPVVYHNVGRGWHFHLQTPPNAIYRGHK